MDPTVTAVRFEHRRQGDALGVGAAAPGVSWITETGTPGWRQDAYEIEVLDEGGEVVAPSGRVESEESVLVPWPADRLRSRQRCRVRVRVWGSDGAASGWSDAAAVEAGLLEPSDWAARFISPEDEVHDEAEDEGEPPTTAPSLLRRDVDLPAPVERARLYVTALGVYEIEINGSRVGDHVLAPGWSSYDQRLRVETLDVTDLLRPGANALGAWLAEGWYGGWLGWNGGRRVYGHQLALLAQLEVALADGTVHTIATGTDGTWRAHASPIIASGIYAGETYDARREQPGWSSPDFDDGGWGPAFPVERDLGTLVARTGPPVRRTEELRPVEVTTSPSGRTVVDFGQNLVGRLRIAVAGDAGATVTLRHAEVLQDGELCTEPLRLAEATDRYTLRGGEGPEVWEPRFTFHGFRYAEVDGWPPGGPPLADSLAAVVCHSDMERTGWFACSDERVTRLHDNVVWGMRGNFLDVPTDCPQRDERLGWTGDINVFAPTASFLYDCAGVLASWLDDLAAEQFDDGRIPLVVPDVLEGTFPAAVWGDAAVVVPWVLYRRFGDWGALRDQYASMRAWVDHVVGLAGENRLWDTGFQLADWLDPAAPQDRPGEARTDPHLVATAALCHSLDVLAEAAGVLGEADDAGRYAGVAAEVRAAFAREYVAPSGLLVSDTQTAYALALRYALLPDDEQRARAGRRLARLVRRAGYRIATGFVGTPLVCDALCDAGEAATAYELLTQAECPSWLYPVLQGATTVWERWDGIRPDGSLNGTRMNSFNHYALGAVADWLHRTLAGLAPAAPGYRRLRIAPVPGGGLTWATARHRTPYGLAESSWRVVGPDNPERAGETDPIGGTTTASSGVLEVTALVPPNTTAEVVLPGADGETLEEIEVGAGRHTWRVPDPAGRREQPDAAGGFSLAAHHRES
ncbi:MAG TPA: family 78 glycoside hydrolase catalytic domain [Acidimicrobiales bacterium]|nr:family 78 glycoside hydrolase catalytic domain [Acidimicrobiales bacterium]